MSKYLYLILTVLITVTVGFSADEKPEIKQKPKSDEQVYKEIRSNIRLFGKVYREINAKYVDQIDSDDFIKAGIKGMLGTLDPYTVFYEPEQVEQLNMLTTGEYGGVGIEIGLKGKDKELTVIAPIDDTPASRKGIRAGDVIVGVNGEPTKGWTTSDASAVIRGEAGTDVTLQIRRVGYDKPLDYVLTREDIRIHDVAYSGIIEEDIGYVKLVRFSGQAGKEFHNSLEDVMDKNPKGLILDLRSNPGGLLPAAVSIASEFLKEDEPIVHTKGRMKRSVRDFNVQGEPLAVDIPLVLLINGGSASASEIVSGAIQDLDRGVIVGTPSFGKGLVQTVINLNKESMLKITTARYYTPSGRLIQRDRIEEDDENDLIELDLSENDQSSLLSDSVESDINAEMFLTRNGREVFGGGGIRPDVELKPTTIDPQVVEMYRRDLFFGFIQGWIKEHGDLKEVNVSDFMLDSFFLYIDSVEFEPVIPGMRELEALRKLGEEDSLDTHFYTQLDLLESMLTTDVSFDDPELRMTVRQGLEREVGSVMGGRELRIKASFDEDVQLSEAIKILRDKDRYNSLLRGSDRAAASAKDH